MFYLLPFYHTSLPHLSRLVVVDLDLEFLCSLSELWNQFSKFSTKSVMSVASNQSPYYYLVTQSFRVPNPTSKIGSPGQLQGLNTGVVLLDMTRARGSPEYNRAATEKGMEEMWRNLLPSSDWGFGDQDWATVLGWGGNNLVTQLGCEYNRQRSKREMVIWKKYYTCDKPTRISHLTLLD